ncbi:MAG: carotenoid 1,2-hydratase [Rubrivivax sp.]|nr:carotenoid 1,2-hydratase [Rubrivivax sp.]
MSPLRRHLLTALAAAPLGARADDDPVRRGRPLVFPRDHGAHTGARTEWWYATGWAGTPESPRLGWQVTFFRSRTGLATQLPGRLAPRQLLFAHAAVTDLAGRRHLHAERLTRWNGEADDGAAGASRSDTRVWIGDWRLQRDATGYRTRVGGEGWSLDLALAPTQPLLLQGDAGFSRKGPEERQASHYYSLPQLQVGGQARWPGQALDASGRAWLDHEWSDEILATDAVGWDWAGINLFDGSALTAFRLRRADGTALWAGGSHRGAAGAARLFALDGVQWQPLRRWRSPATAADYPVEWELATPAGRWRLRALLDAQELDGRAGTGTVYWEGVSELLDESGHRVGLGYLEMTGYAGRLRL